MSEFSSAYFRTLIEDALDIITVADLAGVILYASPSNQRILGYDPDELVGKNSFSFVHEDDLDEATKVWRAGIEQPGMPQWVQFRYRHRDGSWRMLESLGKYVNDAAGPARVIINSRDITERIKLEGIVRQSEKLAAMGQLAAGVAHELNSPLSAILLFSQSMKPRLVPSDPLYTSAASIEREAQRCRHLIQNLLTFSRDHKPGMAPEDPIAVLEGALMLVESQARIRNVVVQREFHAPLPLILVDRQQIQQVVINLCTNALDAMPAGGTLTVSVQAVGEEVEIGIADTGTGITPDVQKRMFEPFFTTKEPGKGTGLGLSLAYEIIQKHRGHIACDSVPGQGTVFMIRLARCETESPIGARARRGLGA